MKDPVFERYDYGEQARSLNMRVNWIVGAVDAHMRKGRQEQKDGVDEYPAKVIRHLEQIISKLRTRVGS